MQEITTFSYVGNGCIKFPCVDTQDSSVRSELYDVVSCHNKSDFYHKNKLCLQQHETVEVLQVDDVGTHDLGATYFIYEDDSCYSESDLSFNMLANTSQDSLVDDRSQNRDSLKCAQLALQELESYLDEAIMDLSSLQCSPDIDSVQTSIVVIGDDHTCTD